MERAKAPKYNPQKPMLLQFHKAVPDFLDCVDTPRDYLERCLNVIEKKIPIHFISGDKDPVGKNGKGVVKFKNLLLDAGFKQVTLKLYPESRHELINDLDRDKVIADVKIWLKAIINLPKHYKQNRDHYT